jgi:hypothetical protein
VCAAMQSTYRCGGLGLWVNMAVEDVEVPDRPPVVSLGGGCSMLRFLGSDIELIVDDVLRRPEGRDLCAAHDSSGQPWIIMQTDTDLSRLSWCCAPVSSRALETVMNCPDRAISALRHSLTGTAEVVTIHNGQCISDKCILGKLVCRSVDNEAGYPLQASADTQHRVDEGCHAMNDGRTAQAAA